MKSRIIHESEITIHEIPKNTENLTGRFIGDKGSQIIGFAGKSKNNRKNQWYVKCYCGSVYITSKETITNGHTNCSECGKKEMGKKIEKDVTGMRFHNLLVVAKISPGLFLCKCLNCYNFCSATSHSMLRDEKKSCSISCTYDKKADDIIGCRFNDLTVIGIEPFNNTYKGICKCDCGNIVLKDIFGIRHFTYQNCGCKLTNKAKESYEKRKKSYNEYITLANKIHNNKYTYPDENKDIFENSKTEIDIICPIHGKFKMRIKSHVVIGKRGCFQCKIYDKRENNEYIGGYTETLFERRPELKNKKAYLYYISFNDGYYYKIGITCSRVRHRASSFKSQSNHFVKKIDIIKTLETTLYDAFTKEQTILKELHDLRIYRNWTTELFKYDVYDKIKHYFE